MKDQKLNIYELNTLSYIEAIKCDKRTYCQYYMDLLKQNQLILFSFFLRTDYNLKIMKILLFILSFSLYFTINAFFFIDDTMNKISIDNGKYNFILQLPQIIYSSLISSVINIAIRNLALSEKNILLVKKQKSMKKVKKTANEILRCIKIKFIIFFILGIVLMLFFWYYVTCFCAVYKNTQSILIKDTIISFILSMCYPFGTKLLSGMFRIPALNAVKKNAECRYKIGSLLSLV